MIVELKTTELVINPELNSVDLTITPILLDGGKIDVVQLNGVDLPVVDKTVNIELGTAAQNNTEDFAPALGADDNYVTDAEKSNLHAPHSDDQDLSNLVEKETGKSLVLDTEIAKLQTYPNFPEVPVGAYLGDDKTFKEIPAPVGGFANNLYFSGVDVADPITDPTTKLLNYALDAGETILSQTITGNEGEKLFRSFLYPDAIGEVTYPSGLWTFNFWAWLSVAEGTTQIGVRYFKYLNGVKTYIFPSIIWSDDVNFLTSSKGYVRIPYGFGTFSLIGTERMGCDVFIKTTGTTATRTVYVSCGDGYPSYLNTPNYLRHKILRAKNEELDYQHFDSTTEKATPIVADSVGLWDSIAVKFVRTSLTNLITFLGSYFGGKTTALTAQTIASTGWTLVGSYYEYDFANVAITADKVVTVIPDNGYDDIISSAKIQAKTVSSAGSVKLYAVNAPTDDIVVTFNLND